MIEMTLSSRHRTRNSNPGGLRPSTLPLGHGGSPFQVLARVNHLIVHGLWCYHDNDVIPSYLKVYLLVVYYNIIGCIF